MTVLDDVADCIPLTITRRHDRPTNEGNGNLSAVRMRSDREDHAMRYFRKDIRIVCERNDRRIERYGAESSCHIMSALPIVADSRKMERASAAR